LKFRGAFVLLRHIGRNATLPNFYGQNPIEACQVRCFSKRPCLQRVLIMISTYIL